MSTSYENSKQVKTGVYEIYVKDHFSAAHELHGYNGNCSKIHGHNWIIETFVQCRQLNEIGIGIDFRDVKDTVKKILKSVDHTHLNDLEPFKTTNPTSENIAKFIYKELERHLNNTYIRVSKVKVCETPGCGSTYWEE
ncbi:MAG: 6-carboxytetrahydropterin synthase QueD [Desulfamplus sp.]|nr:6-carboxytetrahydropterin synthase QueD [Desulfamplus sp.]MBF0412479.1 6-carboxytetrahydropterin synthase QueD [Desulfamplus sp.]